MHPPTTDELLAALARIRTLPRCAGWPADVQQVLADPVRGRLLRIEALRVRRLPAQRARLAPLQRARRNARPRAQRALPPPMSLFDRKRAAAGDRDE